MKFTSQQKQILAAIIVIVFILTGIWYHLYRKGFIVPPVMHDVEQGVFENHPDNAAPDKGGKMPKDLLK